MTARNDDVSLPRLQLREPATEAATPSDRPTMPADLHVSSTDKLQLIGEIARGGMGAILKGRDADLGRDLAVKVLLDCHRDKPELTQRFLEEAQIAGQLQHPGIVPVYQMGRFPDERPYFTMKLVKGQTLSKLLSARKDLSEDLAKFLGIFEQVCQTLGYAHARGVIHRDLKPANVMVGAFGEVQVMDWGLAKVLTEESASRELQSAEAVSVISTSRSRSSDTPAGAHTDTGDVLGTPAYMAPEQARGAVDLLDARCDVFGLGAILCEMLTGQPPYRGRSSQEVQQQAARADLAEAWTRLEACGADVELIALTRRCLSVEPADRPGHGGEVATALAAYRAGVQERLRAAELARIEAQARTVEERKRRRLTVALAVAILALAGLGGGGWLWLEGDRQARERQVYAAYTEAWTKQVQAHLSTGDVALWSEARTAAQGAAALLDSARVSSAVRS